MMGRRNQEGRTRGAAVCRGWWCSSHLPDLSSTARYSPVASAGALTHSPSFCAMPCVVYPHRGAWTEGLSSFSLGDSDALGCSTRRGSGYRGLCVRSSLLPRSTWGVRWTKGHRQSLCLGKQAGVWTLLQHHTEHCQPGLLLTSSSSWPLTSVKAASRYGIRKRY